MSEAELLTEISWPAFRGFLKDLDFPGEVILHPEDYRRVRMLLGGGEPFHDQWGPYVWFETTKVRPPHGSQRSVNMAGTRRFTDQKPGGWR